MANVCYHHSNMLDRPAVANCNACGKSLCQECADRFRSRKTGKSLCVDCYNAQLRKDAQTFEAYAKKHKTKSTIMIVCGSIFGALPILLGVFCLLGALFSFDGELLGIAVACLLVGVWLGAGTTSIALLTKFANRVSEFGFIWPLKIVLFIVGYALGFAVSPIIFAINLTNHIKDTKRFRRFAELNEQLIRTNQEFLAKARSVTSGSMDTERTRALQNEIAALNKKLQDAKAQAERAKTNATVSAPAVDFAQIQAMIVAKVSEVDRARKEAEEQVKQQLAEQAREAARQQEEYEKLKEDMSKIGKNVTTLDKKLGKVA